MDDSGERETLATYQSRLLDLLADSGSLEVAKQEYEALLRELGLSTLEVDSKVDPRMLDVAMQLTKKWGVRASQ